MAIGNEVTTVPGGKPCPRGRRCLGRNLAGGEPVLDRLGVEAVAPLTGRFRLRVHEEGDLLPRRAWQLDVGGVVVGEPVYLPGAEQTGARLLDLGIAERGTPVFLEDELSHVGGVDGDPAVARGVELGAAMLALADVAAPAEALVVGGLRHSAPVDVTRGNAQGADHTHE